MSSKFEKTSRPNRPIFAVVNNEVLYWTAVSPMDSAYQHHLSSHGQYPLTGSVYSCAEYAMYAYTGRNYDSAFVRIPI